MRELFVFTTEAVPSEALALRAECFYGPEEAEQKEDEFDRRSLHLVLSERSQVAAYGRLTIGPPGVFRTWSNGAAQLPAASDVADLGRCFVHPDYRGVGLLKFVCIEGLRIASKLSVRLVNGAYIPGERVEKCVKDIGFEDSGNTVEQLESSGLKVKIQPVTCDLVKSSAIINIEYNSIISRISKVGFALKHDAKLAP